MALGSPSQPQCTSNSVRIISMLEEPIEHKKRQSVTDFAIFLVIPLLAYLITFAYRVGFAHFLRLSYISVSINAISISRTNSIMSTIVLMILFVRDVIFRIFPELRQITYICFRRIIIPIMIIGSFLFLHRLSWNHQLQLIALSFCILFLLLLFLISEFGRPHKSFKLEDGDIIKKPAGLVLSCLYNSIGKKTLFVILCMWIVLSLSYVAGRATAMKKTGPTAIAIQFQKTIWVA